jgi:hypothetical protein
MFAFKSLSWKTDKVKFVFLGLSVVILAVGAAVGASAEGIWIGLIRGVAGCIGLYVFMSILASYLSKED